MKVLYRKIVHDVGDSVSRIEYPHFNLPFHCHDTCELIVMTSGTGREYVGYGVADYCAGDVTLIGKHIPHLHLCDFVTGKSVKRESTCEILYFPDSFFPTNLEEIDEYRTIAALLEKSRQGVRFRDAALAREVRQRMKKTARAEGVERIRHVLALLDTLGQTAETTLISEAPVKTKPTATRHTLADRIETYLQQHFSKPLVLESVAQNMGMHPSALCRRLKRETGQTLFAWLNAIRVKNACRLLQETSLAVSIIAWESGFANLSHFNRQFKAVTGQTPGAYRKRVRLDMKPVPGK